MRPGILAEPGPQRSDRSQRRLSGDCLPTLGLTVLAGVLEEQVDSALRFLTASALEGTRKLEEEEKEKAKVKKLKEEMEAAEHEEKMLELNRRFQAENHCSLRSARLCGGGCAPTPSPFRPQLGRGGRKRRVRGVFLGLLPAPHVAVLVVDNGSGTLAMLVSFW